ncbi:hypothetical protein NDU88_005216 [Pleurodeles waltl]|uniref:Uncharacterized protein n=1 Tax=Pleurodeles waltl TaxID=8319 RepID=A0AAV7NLT5_PLEWA|nr:hypothetical protein NDU88_005216 [Pleurodeles waltl]
MPPECVTGEAGEQESLQTGLAVIGYTFDMRSQVNKVRRKAPKKQSKPFNQDASLLLSCGIVVREGANPGATERIGHQTSESSSSKEVTGVINDP